MMEAPSEFLQSEEWREFQESVGRRTFHFETESMWANVIEHELPLVGKYGYIPRGPISKSSAIGHQSFDRIFELARENSWGWVRFDPASEEMLKMMQKNVAAKITKAPHNMQPKELFAIDITKSEDQLLAEMKPKTRYNIRLAEKRGCTVTSHSPLVTGDKRIEEFLRLNRIMAKRQGIVTHPDGYYRKMVEEISGEMLKLYVAEYQGKIVAANIVVFYGSTATYLHGASDDKYRNVMAPYLLQWRQIQDGKMFGCTTYDFGGVKTEKSDTSWTGITRFKLGFSPRTSPFAFPGSYDIIMRHGIYGMYRIFQSGKLVLRKLT